MTKREKREERRKERLYKALDAALAQTKKRCSKCGQFVAIGAIDSWATCQNCGNLVSRRRATAG